MTLSLQDYRDALLFKQGKSNKFAATDIVTYQYWAKVIRVVDGDTVDLEISLGFEVHIFKRCRLFGINSPEFYSAKRNSPERIAGKAAKDWLSKIIVKNTWIEIKIFSDSPHDKYGRWIVVIYQKGTSINELIVTAGHAVFSV